MLFCEIHPVCYEISLKKEICKRHIRDLLSKEKFAKTINDTLLPNVVASYSCNLIKRGKGVDLRLQENKAVNIRLACRKIDGIMIYPDEIFSFWHTVGKTTKAKGYKDGRVIIHNKLIPGLGGGLCNLGNTIHYMILHSLRKKAKGCPSVRALPSAIITLITVSKTTRTRISSSMSGVMMKNYMPSYGVKKNFPGNIPLWRKTIIFKKKTKSISGSLRFTGKLRTVQRVKCSIKNSF